MHFRRKYMERNSFLAVLIIVSAVGLSLTSCTQSDEDGTTAQDVEVETTQLISTIRQYTAEQRDEAIDEASQALEKLDGQINELESRIDRNWDTMSEQTRQQARDNLERLRERRSELADWYDDFRNSSAGAWDEMKAGFTGAYRVMSDSWVNAKREFEEADNE
jgi:TolA-binding protein